MEKVTSLDFEKYMHTMILVRLVQNGVSQNELIQSVIDVCNLIRHYQGNIDNGAIVADIRRQLDHYEMLQAQLKKTHTESNEN